MLIKIITILLLSATLSHCAKLRKTPKVYNALITTDEELTPSKAYPLIQPVFQPFPVFSPIYPVSFADQYVPGANNGNAQNAERKFDPANPQEINNAEVPEKPSDSKSALPLNEYGLPPSLIPLKNFPQYPYSVPFFYDSYGNYQAIQYPVLPPVDYYNPQQDRKLPPIDAPMFEVKPGARNLNQPEENSSQPSIPQSPVSSDSIKNIANKNAEIPDVEIPPLPVRSTN